jgi:hypothetical protein
MAGPTAFVGGTGTIAHVANTPVYVAPAGHTQVAPAGRTQPHQVSSGVGINVDSNS